MPKRLPPPRGKFRPGSGFPPQRQPRPGKRPSSQTTCFKPEPPIPPQDAHLLQRPAHPQPPPGETISPRLYPGPVRDGHLTWLSPAEALPPPAPHTCPAVGEGRAREPGAPRVGPRACRARLTKSGAAPCGRATGGRAGAQARGRDLGPGSAFPSRALAAPADVSPVPRGLGVPSSRRTRLPPARAAPAAGRPPPRALGAPPPGPLGLQVRGPGVRDARACQAASPLPPATRTRARPPRAIQHRAPPPPRTRWTGREPAASPAPRALPWEPEQGRTAGGSSKGGGGGGARPGLERRGAEGSGSHNGRARGAEPPAPRALAAAAEAEPAQPPNPLPHPRRRRRPPPLDARSPRPAPHPRPLPRSPRAPARPQPGAPPRTAPRALPLGPYPPQLLPCGHRVPRPIHTPTFPAPCSRALSVLAPRPLADPGLAHPPVSPPVPESLSQAAGPSLSPDLVLKRPIPRPAPPLPAFPRPTFFPCSWGFCFRSGERPSRSTYPLGFW
ncbi:basic proline-rich protein-like [Neovison vison]|uniref:basic proline-rich protein-like n=1 Tax=Neovison vison TaxID=452646 RepID=UPI001CF00722|nr:basic proline-rich protein-like [Neogale vison]